MTDGPVFLTVGHVVAVHRRMIAEFGGNPALRDAGMLESAVMLPAARFGGKFLHRGVPAMAAAYLFHIRRNHAFMDGNKRTALATAEVFLLLNRHVLKATDDELDALTFGIADGTLSKDDATRFFRRHAGRA